MNIKKQAHVASPLTEELERLTSARIGLGTFWYVKEST
jgi:hypothetical protein